MNVLIIDTASDLEIVALASGNSGHAVAADAARSHAVTLFASIDSCLKTLGIGINDVNLIGVGSGPGSFTGVRIAVTTARMIAQIRDIPLVGLPSQEIYARSASAAPGDLVMAAFDAKKNRVFGGLYRTDARGALTTLVPPGDYAMEELARGAGNAASPLCVGNGAVRYAAMLREMFPHVRFMERIMPDATALAAWVAAQYAEKPDNYRDYRTVVPMYARKSDAELMKQAGRG